MQGIPRLAIVAPDGRTVQANAVQTPLSLAQLDAWAQATAAAAAPGGRGGGCCGGGCRK